MQVQLVYNMLFVVFNKDLNVCFQLFQFVCLYFQESINSKFATFAIIYLGNMIYDTQLISNIDASLTDIGFNETLIL